MRVPRKGDRYRVKTALPIIVMTGWAAPCTGGEKAILPAGEAFIVSNDPFEGATAVSCDAVRYERLHAQLVSEEDRNNPLYCGYWLCIDIDFIMSRCKRVGTAGEE